MYRCVYIYIYIYTHVSLSLYLSICTHTHAHTHTHIHTAPAGSAKGLPDRIGTMGVRGRCSLCLLQPCVHVAGSREAKRSEAKRSEAKSGRGVFEADVLRSGQL